MAQTFQEGRKCWQGHCKEAQFLCMSFPSFYDDVLLGHCRISQRKGGKDLNPKSWSFSARSCLGFGSKLKRV